MSRLIAITHDGTDNLCREAALIMRALETHRFDRIHVRKSTVTAIHCLLDLIDPRFYNSISVHNATSHTVCRYPDIGVHLTGHTPVPPGGFNGTLSRSCHSINELHNIDSKLDYVFLSPVFDSISKPGYNAAFDNETLRQASSDGLINDHVIALGGVTSRHLPMVKELGFGGAAMLGAAWPDPIGMEFALQFISHTNDRITDPLHGIELALEGGCRWCQLRLKDSDTDTIKTMARRAAGIAAPFNATLIIDDDVEAVRDTDAHGVHLGLNDMPVAQARRILPDKIIGATANTAADIIAAWKAGADYIGLGPYRFTTTKKKLSPVLGTDGYRREITIARNAGVDIPIVAIGGITESDIAGILDCGPDGVAISGAILNAPDPAKATRHIIDIITSIK